MREGLVPDRLVEHGSSEYGWYCGIISLGVVMAELITRTLSHTEGTLGSGGSFDVRTVYGS